MKIVLDTNVLVNSFLRKSKNYWIWKALEAQQLTLCVTTDILLEYEEIITRLYKDPLMAFISPLSKKAVPTDNRNGFLPLLLQPPLKQPQNPFILIHPRSRLDKTVVFHRVGCEFPIVFFEFYQPLCEADGR